VENVLYEKYARSCKTSHERGGVGHEREKTISCSSVEKVLFENWGEGSQPTEYSIGGKGENTSVSDGKE